MNLSFTSISIVTGLPKILQHAIYLISTSLLYPVIVILLGLTALIVVELGMFSFEWLNRARASRWRQKRKKNLENGVLEAKALIEAENVKIEECVKILEYCTSSKFIYSFLDRLLDLEKNKNALPKNNPAPASEWDLFSINLERLLQECEIMIAKRMERMKVMVRLGPMFGLMGTLIPMGPALLALTQGNIEMLANNLIIAFGTTVVGLLVGGVAYLISTIRTRWYDKDMNDIAYICEVLFGGKK
jgi:hypothetical protein